MVQSERSVPGTAFWQCARAHFEEQNEITEYWRWRAVQPEGGNTNSVYAAAQRLFHPGSRPGERGVMVG